MPGAKPKPTKIKKLEGNPGKRPLNEKEPQPKRLEDIKAPNWLDRKAKAEWNRVVPELHRLGILTKIDISTLEAYCQSYAKWKEAELFLMKHGMTTLRVKKDRDGNVLSEQSAPYPEVYIANNALDQMRKLAAEFGMTPASRTRIQVADDDDDSTLKKLID